MMPPDTTHGRSQLHTRRNRGMTLIEVLVTLVVVAIGLLGVAGLQLTSMKLGLVSENRSNGVVLVSNILDRMRTNADSITAYAITFGSTTPTGTTQPEKDIAEFKAQIASVLPDGDAEIIVTQGDVTSCDAPLIAKCWDVAVALRWNEGNVRGGNSGSAQTFLRISSRI